MPLRKLLLVLVLLAIFCCALYSQPSSTVDSIKNLIGQSKDDSLKMEWYNQLRKLTVFKHLPEAKVYADEYLQLAKKNKYPFKVALGHAYKGNLFVRLGDYENAIQELLTAVQYFESTNDSIRMGSVYNSIAAAYENVGNDSLTTEYFQKSYLIFDNLKDAKRTAFALNNLGNIEFRMGNFEESELYLKRAVTLLETLLPEFEEHYLIIKTNLANTQVELKKYVEAKTEKYQALHHYDNLSCLEI